MEYALIRSSRKTIAIEITPSGSILVRCPRRMRNAQIQQFVDSKSGWIMQKLAAQASQETLPGLTQAQLSQLAQQAKLYFSCRTSELADALGLTYGRITIRCQRTRWGSCSSRGNLSFNCLLMLAPEAVRDYVIVHELCHRLHMNHSPAFWAQVEQAMPDYARYRQWLKDNGRALLARVPET